MKYPQSVSMPEAVRCWLEEELEARGIDAAIYSRYIFSLLQQKSLDEPPVREVRRGRKRGHKDYALDLDQQRRSAAVECLMSASDQKSGIEALVDELCTKLQVIQSEASKPQETATTIDTGVPIPLSSKDLESKYYAAFPALISKDKPKTEVFTSPLSCNGNKFSVWNSKKILGCSFGKNQLLFNSGIKEKSLKNKWGEENKENQVVEIEATNNEKMRSRSMIKQQITQKVRRNMAKSLDRKDDLLKLRTTFDSGKTRRLDESNFNKLLAKFDGVKDIWANDKPSDDLSGCDENLPMDFQQLLDSPDTTMTSESIPLEFYKNNNVKENILSSCSTSFIQCGTNITSSIWSEKKENACKAEEDCDSFGQCANNTNSNILPPISGGSVWSNVKDEYQMENNQASDPWGFGNNMCLDLASKDVDFVMNETCSLQDRKWSSEVGANDLKMNDEEFYLCKQNIHMSLLTLNHNKEGSCFIEVVPSKYLKRAIKKYSELKPKLMNYWKRPGPLTGMCWEEEEEDLLTSMRTHFQPISSKEVIEVVREKTVPSVPKYADGTTFQVSNSWEKPNFLRSESGALYLDSDPEHKYREFQFDFLDTADDFIPKFKVCQNEKFCQTEDILMNSSDNEEFYFPGDGKFAEDSIEKDSTAACITVDGWVTAWPAGIWSNTPQPWCDVWSAEVSVMHEGGDHYLKLRDEILEEGEELLSDLSSMQHLFLTSDEALPVAPSSHIETGFVCKTNSIPLSSEMVRKGNERHIAIKTAPHLDSKRQPLSAIASWTGSVVI